MNVNDIIINSNYKKIVRRLTPEEYSNLEADIQKNNQVFVQVMINTENVLLDGHHRLEIAKELGIDDIPSKTLYFEDKLDEWEYVVNSNKNRRQLTTIDKAVLANELHKIEQERTARLRPKIGGRPPKPKSQDRLLPIGSNHPTTTTTTTTQAPKKPAKKRLRKKVDPTRKKAMNTRTSRHKAAKNQGIGTMTLKRYQAVQDSKHDDLRSQLDRQTISINEAHSLMQKRDKRQAVSNEILKADPVLTQNVADCLKHGDFRKLANEIKDNSVKLLLTDPPYDEKNLWQYEYLGKLSFEKLPNGGSLVTYAGHWALPQIIRYLEGAGLTWRWIITVKHAGDRARYWKLPIFVYWKPLLWFTKGNELPDVKEGTIHDFIQSQPSDKSLHPWQQPFIESEYIIKHLTNPGDTVLDPFAGSGTNLVAAAKLGRIPRGFEIDMATYDIACGNLANAFKEIENGGIMMMSPDRNEELSKIRETNKQLHKILKKREAQTSTIVS